MKAQTERLRSLAETFGAFLKQEQPALLDAYDVFDYGDQMGFKTWDVSSLILLTGTAFTSPGGC